MPLNQVSNIRASELYEDTFDYTQAETTPITLQDDLNMVRTMLRVVSGGVDWFSTPATTLSAAASALTTIGGNLSTHIGDTSVHYTQAQINHNSILNRGAYEHTTLDAHVDSVSNPHGITTSQIGAADAVHVHTVADIANFANEVASTLAVSANTLKVSADGSVNTHSDVDTVSSPPSVGDALKWNGSNWVPGPVSGGGGGLALDSDIYTPTLYQTAFPLTQPPVGKTLAFVNGIGYYEGLDFQVSGSTLTWNPGVAGFQLGPTDRLTVYYEV